MHIFIDESGSMTHNTDHIRNKYFHIALVLSRDPKKLLKVYKRFISKYYTELKAVDYDHKMFKGDKFKEIKGAVLSADLKRQFVSYFGRNELFKVLYITIDNEEASYNLYRDKAMAFNYVLNQALNYLYDHAIIRDRILVFQIDDRNIKKESKQDLEKYLITEFIAGLDLADSIEVNYYDSSANPLIQVADVMANLMYSNEVTKGGYEDLIEKLKAEGYIVNIMNYPV